VHQAWDISLGFPSDTLRAAYCDIYYNLIISEADLSNPQIHFQQTQKIKKPQDFVPDSGAYRPPIPVVISPNGQRLVSEYHGKVVVWESDRQGRFRRIHDFEVGDDTRSMVFSYDGHRLALGGSKKILIWSSLSSYEGGGV
jgi:WD40 repeat protein